MHQTITGACLDGYLRTVRTPDGTDALPLTGAQRRFLFVQWSDPRGRPDLMPLFFAFPRGAFDPARLRAAAHYVVAAHPALRMSPRVVRGVPLQYPRAPTVALSRVGRVPGESAATAVRRALFNWPVGGPAMRLLLAEDGEREILVLALDHAAVDEESLTRLLTDLAMAYADRLSAADVSDAASARAVEEYRQAVLAQLDAEVAACTPAALGYWADRLREAAPSAAAHRGPAMAEGYGVLHCRVPVPRAEGRRWAFPALLSAVSAAAGAVHRDGAVPVIGYPWGNRATVTSGVAGCFLNTVPFHATSGDDRDGTADAWWDDLDHADVPFDEIVRTARATRGRWAGELSGTVVLEDLGRRPPLRLGGCAGQEIHVDGRPPRTPFAVSAAYGTDLVVRMVWDRSVCGDRTAERAFERLTDLLRHHIEPRDVGLPVPVALTSPAHGLDATSSERPLDV